jgi:hypothetical protein
MTKAPRQTPAAKAADAGPARTGEIALPDLDTPAAATAAADRQEVMKMKQLLAAVARATGARPTSVKPAVEATVAALGAALHSGRSLNLPGLGRARVARGGDGKPLTIKLKAGAAKVRPKAAQEALAEDED